MNKKILLCITALLAWFIGFAQSPVWVKQAHPDGLQVNGVIFSGDGQSVLSGTNCFPAKIRRFSVADGAITWDYTVGTTLECMMGVAMSSNEQYFATAEETGHLMLFDYTQNPPVLAQTLDLGTTYAFSVDFSPNSQQVVVGCSNGKLNAYNLPSGALAWSVATSSTWVTAVDYAADNSKIATGGNDNKVKIWDTAGTLLHTLSGHTDDITAVKFTPDNQKVVSTGRDKKMRIWDANTGSLLQTITVSGKVVNGLDLSPDGQYAVTASDTLLKVWSLTDYSPVASFSTNEWDIAIAVSWSPVSSHIVCGTSNGSIALFDVAGSVGTKDLPGLNVQVYPNPFADMLNVEWPSTTQIIRAELFDLEGRLCLSQHSLANQSSTKLNLSGLTPGAVLVLRLTALDGRTYEKLVQKQ